MRSRDVRGNEAEFAAFYEANRDACLRALVVRTGNLGLAEELTADAFARAWAKWSSVRKHPAPTAWVLRAAMNAGVSRWRKRRRETALVDADVIAPDAPSGGLDNELLDLLRQLPMRQREVVALRIVLDLDTVTTATVLGIAPGTVTAHLARAMATLRDSLPSDHPRKRSNDE